MTREVARQFRPTTLEELEGGKRRKVRPRLGGLSGVERMSGSRVALGQA